MRFSKIQEQAIHNFFYRESHAEVYAHVRILLTIVFDKRSGMLKLSAHGNSLNLQPRTAVACYPWTWDMNFPVVFKRPSGI
jgi:hypothetical protein